MLPVLAVGIFLAFVDMSIIFAISEDIASELNGLSYVPWIATAFFLSTASTQPLYGKLSDVFGRKPCLLFAYTVFGLGSLGCGLSTTMGGLIAARVSIHINSSVETPWLIVVLDSPRCWSRRHDHRSNGPLLRYHSSA